MIWTRQIPSPLHMLSSPRLWLALVAVGSIATIAISRKHHRGELVDGQQYPDSNHNHCPNCLPAKDPKHEKEIHSLRIEGIKQEILNKLGLKAEPRLSADIPKKALLQSLYASGEARRLILEGEESIRNTMPFLQEDNYYAKTSEIISLAEPGPLLNNHTLLQFKQSSEDVSSLRVTEAILWVYISSSQSSRVIYNPHRPRTKLWVFRLPSAPILEENPSGELVSSLRITNGDYGWHQLNVTDAKNGGFPRPGQNLRLLVDCSGCGNKVRAELFPAKNENASDFDNSSAEETHRPFLVIHTTSSPSRRLARRALQCDKDTKMCCKQNLYISFKELGWDDWILAPSGYHANYCKGSCASIYRPLDSFSTFYSQIIEELNRKRVSKALTQCCAPTQFSSMTLIYLDGASNIIMRNVPRMVVEECGCV